MVGLSTTASHPNGLDRSLMILASGACNAMLSPLYCEIRRMDQSCGQKRGKATPHTSIMIPGRFVRHRFSPSRTSPAARNPGKERQALLGREGKEQENNPEGTKPRAQEITEIDAMDVFLEAGKSEAQAVSRKKEGQEKDEIRLQQVEPLVRVPENLQGVQRGELCDGKAPR
jgi:hypothetical protein